jgi:thiosulfate/3-mercaptopyruvate sulfurtransferase
MTFRSPQYLVDTDWLARHLDDPELRIIECSVGMPNYHEDSAGDHIEIVSGRGDYEQGHIPRSDFVDLVTEFANQDDRRSMFPLPSAEQFAAVMSSHGIGEGVRVVLYDRTMNAWAARFWWMLRTFGFDGAVVLNGGWAKWSTENRPTSVTPSKPATKKFMARHRPELIATKEEVRQAIGDESSCIINALNPDEFAGRGPVRYGRPGHIPTSVNVPAMELAEPNNHAYLDAETLREKFAVAGAFDKDRVITHCGGGIAASSDAFVLTLLGVEKVALYNGSMTEWAADPELPLEMGI